MTRKDSEIERTVRDRIIQGNREDFAERQFEDSEIRRLIKLEKILKIIFCGPVIIISALVMLMIIQGIFIWFGWM